MATSIIYVRGFGAWGNLLCATNPQIFQKFWSHLKIIDARRVKRSSNILRAQNSGINCKPVIWRLLLGTRELIHMQAKRLRIILLKISGHTVQELGRPIFAHPLIYAENKSQQNVYLTALRSHADKTPLCLHASNMNSDCRLHSTKFYQHSFILGKLDMLKDRPLLHAFIPTHGLQVCTSPLNAESVHRTFASAGALLRVSPRTKEYLHFKQDVLVRIRSANTFYSAVGVEQGEICN
jgi:hypothetical protein